MLLFLDTKYIILDLLNERNAKNESSAAHKCELSFLQSLVKLR